MTTIRLNEQALAKLISENVKKILNERNLSGLTPAPIDEKNVSSDGFDNLLESWDLVRGVKMLDNGFFAWLKDNNTMLVTYSRYSNKLQFRYLFEKEPQDDNEYADYELYLKTTKQSFIKHLVDYWDLKPVGEYTFRPKDVDGLGSDSLVMTIDELYEGFALCFWWGEEN